MQPGRNSTRRSPDEELPNDDSGYSPGVLTWVGLGLAVVGGAGTVVFAIRTDEVHQQFEMRPTESLAEEGELMMVLETVSIGVVAVGAALFLIDLLTSL